MPPLPFTHAVFDAYGTLFDVAGAARVAAEQPGQERLAEVWPKLAVDWRAKQLQYTWLRAVTGDHTTFWQVTCDGLDWAMEASGLDDPLLRELLLALYWECPAYDEAASVLKALRGAEIGTAILSNGSPDMLDGAVDHAELGSLLDAVLSVEDVGVFKPAAAVYDLVGTRLGAEKSEVLFVSANGWDAGCAAAYGFETVWLNRQGDPVDRLPGTPAHVLPDLTGVPGIAGVT